MSSTHSEDSASSPNRQGDLAPFSKIAGTKWFPAPRGETVIQLLTLSEIQERWNVTEYRVYRAVALRQIKAYGRPGKQKYYSAREIEDWLSSSVSGRQLRWSEFDTDQLAV